MTWLHIRFAHMAPRVHTLIDRVWPWVPKAGLKTNLCYVQFDKTTTISLHEIRPLPFDGFLLCTRNISRNARRWAFYLNSTEIMAYIYLFIDTSTTPSVHVLPWNWIIIYPSWHASGINWEILAVLAWQQMIALSDIRRNAGKGVGLIWNVVIG